MIIIADRVKEASVTTGTGVITLAGAYGGFQTFLDGIGDGNSTYYAIENDVRWEVGIGTYNSAGNTLSRDIIFDSSNGGSGISLAGVSTVFCTLPADRAVYTVPEGSISGAQFIGTTVFKEDVIASGTTTFDDGFVNFIRPNSKGNFFHAYKDDGTNRTIGLYVNEQINDPLFKFGFKINPLDETEEPNYSYLFGRESTAGVLNDSGNYFQIGAGFGFAVTSNYNNVFIASSDDGVSVTPDNLVNPSFVVEKSLGSSQDIQQWLDSDSSVFSAVDSEGKFGILLSNPLYPLHVAGSGKIGSMIFSSGIYFADGSYQDTAATGSALAVSGWAEETIYNVSGYFQDYVDSQDHSAVAVSGWAQYNFDNLDLTGLSGWADYTMTDRDNAISGYFQTYVDSQDHSASAVSGWADATMTNRDNAVSGWADATIVHLSGWADTTITNGDNAVSGWADNTFDLQAVTDRGDNTTNSIYTAGDFFASGDITATSGQLSGINFTVLLNGDQPGYQEGRVFYDGENHALAVYNDEADITLQVGQEEYIRVRNNCGSGISNGQAVYITGSQGQHVTVNLAYASGELQSEAVGLATHDIENNSFGYVTSFGLVRGINTTAFNEGDEIFVSTINGQLTNVAPIAPNYRTSIGHVVNRGVNGSILVTPRDHRLGGGDVKTLGGIKESGIAFIDLVAGTDAAIIKTDTQFCYDSGNAQVILGSGGLKFSDGTIQTTAGGGGSVSGTPSGVAFFGADGQLTDDPSAFVWDATNDRLLIGPNAKEDTTLPNSYALQVYDADDAVVQVKSSGSTAAIVIRADLTGSTFGTYPNQSSLNESQMVFVYGYSGGAPLSGPVSTAGWYLGMSKDQPVNRESDLNLFTLSTTNKWSGSVWRVNRSKQTSMGAFASPNSYNTTLLLYPNNAAEVGFTVKGQSAQSANLTEWQDDASTVLASVDPVGTFSTASGEIHVYNSGYAIGASDYERIETKWDDDIAQIGTFTGGTGTARTIDLVYDGSARFRGDSSFSYMFQANGQYIFFGANALKPQSSTAFNLGGSSADQRWGTLYTDNVDLSGILYDQTQSPGTAGQHLISTATGVKWTSSSESVSGIPSGVAFFGDDGLLSYGDDQNFVWNSGEGKLIVGNDQATDQYGENYAVNVSGGIISREGGWFFANGTMSFYSAANSKTIQILNNNGSIAIDRVYWNMGPQNYGTTFTSFNFGAGNVATFPAKHSIYGSDTTIPVSIVRSPAAHNASLTEWQDASEDKLAIIDTDGSFATSGELQVYGSGTVGETSNYHRLRIRHTTSPFEEYRIGVDGANKNIAFEYAGAKKFTITGEVFTWVNFLPVYNNQLNIGSATARFEKGYITDLYTSGILHASGDIAGTEGQVLTAYDNGVIKWQDANTLPGLSGTPSGVAFFGDDGVITDDSNFVFSSGDPLLKIRVSGDATNNIEWRIGDDPDGNPESYHILLGPNGTANITNRADIGIGGSSPIYHRYRKDITAIQSVINGNTRFSVGMSSSFIHTDLNPNSTADSHNLGQSNYVWGQVYGGKLISYIQNSTDVGVTVKGAASQSANLTEWQNSAGDVLSEVKSDGSIYVSGSIGIGNSNPTDRLVVAGNLKTTHFGQVTDALRVTHNSNDVFLSLYKRADQGTAVIKLATTGDSYFNAGNVSFGYDVSAPKGVDSAEAFGLLAVAANSGTAIGYDAEATGTKSTAIGYLTRATTDSVSVGMRSTSKFRSTSIGPQVGINILDGQYMDLMGYSAGLASPYLSSSVGVGGFCLASASGTGLTAFGFRSLQGASGNYNIAIGYEAGQDVVGTGNITICNRDNKNTIGTNDAKLNINDMIKGDFNAGTLGINTDYNPGATLHAIAANTTDVVGLFEGVAGQSANVLEVKDSDGNTDFSVNAVGTTNVRGLDVANVITLQSNYYVEWGGGNNRIRGLSGGVGGGRIEFIVGANDGTGGKGMAMVARGDGRGGKGAVIMGQNRDTDYHLEVVGSGSFEGVNISGALTFPIQEDIGAGNQDFMIKYDPSFQGAGSTSSVALISTNMSASGAVTPIHIIAGTSGNVNYNGLRVLENNINVYSDIYPQSSFASDNPSFGTSTNPFYKGHATEFIVGSYFSQATLVGDGQNKLGLRNGTSAQTFNLYNTYTSASNYARLQILGDGADYVIQAANAGAGSQGNTILRAGSATTIPSVIQGAASQSANLTEWQDNAGDVISYTDNSGVFYRNIRSSGTDTEQVWYGKPYGSNAVQAFWRDFTDGTEYAGTGNLRFGLWANSARTSSTWYQVTPDSHRFEITNGLRALLRATQFDINTHITPYTQNTWDVGTAVDRWRTVYTRNLNVSGILYASGDPGTAGQSLYSNANGIEWRDSPVSEPVTNASGVTNMMVINSGDYEGITPDANTLYFIVDP